MRGDIYIHRKTIIITLRKKNGFSISDLLISKKSMYIRLLNSDLLQIR